MGSFSTLARMPDTDLWRGFRFLVWRRGNLEPLRAGSSFVLFLAFILQALQRMGALFFEGTTGATVEGCELLRLDGNGIMLSGFNQWTTIRHNHIAFTGDTAIAGWGFTSGSDPNQPKGTGPDGTKGTMTNAFDIISFVSFRFTSANTITHVTQHVIYIGSLIRCTDRCASGGTVSKLGLQATSRGGR